MDPAFETFLCKLAGARGLTVFELSVLKKCEAGIKGVWDKESAAAPAKEAAQEAEKAVEEATGESAE